MKQNNYITPCLMENKAELRMCILAGSVIGNGAFNGSKNGEVDPPPSMPFGAKDRNNSMD